MENVHLERRVTAAKNEMESVIDELVETINQGQRIITNLENEINRLNELLEAFETNVKG